jgi:flagellar protein FlaG
MDLFSAINNNTIKTEYSHTQTNQINHQKNTQEIQQANQENKEEKENIINGKSKEELEKELQKVVEELNKAMNPLNQDLKFKYDNKTDELIVKVIDTKTDKVIRQFPPEEALKLMEKMREIVGLLFDKKG